VQSRIKELEKIERIELPNEEKTIHFSFPQPEASGRVVTEFRNVAKSYGDKRVFSGVNFVINRGDRIGLVGVNGAGKSTLIKLLSNTEPPSSGEARLGHNVSVDYFAQDQYKVLNPAARLIDDLSSVAPSAMSGQTQLRTLLGCFLFSGDDVFKPIGVLSGGERNRYALARMLLVPPNFMLLDEPTNHLDLHAKDVLLEALRDHKGTVVFVSHDRYFIDKLATRIFEIENGELRDYAGNYEDYLWQKQRPAGVSAEPQDATPALAIGAVEKQVQRPTRRRNPHVVRKMEERRQDLECDISRCESEIAEAEQGLANFKNAEESIRLAKAVPQLRSRLQELMQEWEQLSVELEGERS
jgi:ATP-binding cassette subfamily F protein 3